MPLHSPTVRVPRIARAAAVATVCMAAGAATVVITDEPVAQARTVAGTAHTRYFDLEANKAAGMRALGLHIAEQRADASR